MEISAQCSMLSHQQLVSQSFRNSDTETVNYTATQKLYSHSESDTVVWLLRKDIIIHSHSKTATHSQTELFRNGHKVIERQTPSDPLKLDSGPISYSLTAIVTLTGLQMLQ